ncbi:MAG TPA: ABC transporter permease [Lachnospiraceae bacterium]|nr:ABC transporter permease [Lachnospiraceae bacterium]
MKRFIQKFTVKQIILCILGTLSLFIFLGLTTYSKSKQNSLLDQQIASRWSKNGKVAQISCFFSEKAAVEEMQLQTFEHQLDSLLLEASIVVEKENARLWVDSYSAMGEISVTSGKTTITVDGVGIGGDFFLFHPLNIIKGGYFSGNDLMQDHIIIDENIAWLLFGSSDVVGMDVTIGGVPHTVVGVISREEGRLNKAAGHDSSTIYVSYSTMSAYGTSKGIGSYEVLMPNPIKGFALSAVKKNIGVAEEQMKVLENSKRFSLFSMLGVIKEFGTRSMSIQEIIFPYWENVARGWEDILAVVLLFQILFLLFPIILLIIMFVHLWKIRTWHWKDVKNMIDKIWEMYWLHKKNRDNKIVGEK